MFVLDALTKISKIPDCDVKKYYCSVLISICYKISKIFTNRIRFMSVWFVVAPFFFPKKANSTHKKRAFFFGTPFDKPYNIYILNLTLYKLIANYSIKSLIGGRLVQTAESFSVFAYFYKIETAY